jgi:AAA+ ATPase superfamily predicted ATPase
MKNTIPFVYGRIVTGSEFVNREAELERLTINLQSGLNTILISPRRWGKSSLVNRAVEKISKTDSVLKVCRLDLFNIRTEKEFYESFVREVLRSTSGKWEEWISHGKNFLKSMVPRFSVGTDPVHDFSVSFELLPEKKSIEDILMLPERIAKSKKIKIVVCIDEFQNLSFYENPLEFQKQLRASWQTHKSVSYCLYGSKRHMIADLFENKSMPFYKFGDLMFLEPISTTHWKQYITASFQKTGKKISMEAAEEIAVSVKNHPYFVQQLAQKVWVITENEAISETVQFALNTLLNENAILYLREVENLSNTQVNLLKAICNRVEQLSSAETIHRYSLGTSANVLRIKAALEQKEIIDFLGRQPEFIDPVFELWLKRIYFQ